MILCSRYPSYLFRAFASLFILSTVLVAVGCSKLTTLVVRNRTDKQLEVHVKYFDSSGHGLHRKTDSVLDVAPYSRAEDRVGYRFEGACSVTVYSAGKIVQKEDFTPRQIERATIPNLRNIYLDIRDDSMSFGLPTIIDQLTENPTYIFGLWCCCAPIGFLLLVVFLLLRIRASRTPKVALEGNPQESSDSQRSE